MAFLQGNRLPSIVVSALVIAGFVAVMVLLIARPVQVEAAVLDILKIMTGALATMTSQVVQYHIGSSAGSKAKDDILSGIATKGP